MPWDIISLHLCTTNDNHIVYGSWGMEHNRQIVLSFWVIFCSFTSLTRKIRILKKWKQFLEIYRYTSSFYNCIPQMKIIWYIKWKKKKKKNRKKKHLEALQTHDVGFLRYGVQQAEFLVILGHFLPFYPTNNPQNQIFEKIIILHKCTKNLDHIIMFICYTVPEIWCVRCFFFFHFGLFFALLTSKQP